MDAGAFQAAEFGRFLFSAKSAETWTKVLSKICLEQSYSLYENTTFNVVHFEIDMKDVTARAWLMHMCIEETSRKLKMDFSLISVFEENGEDNSENI